jgi:hypothetical protein
MSDSPEPSGRPVFEFFVDTRPAHGFSLFRAIKFLGHKLAMPGEYGIGFDDGGDVFEGLLAEFLADLGEGLTLGASELYTSFNLLAQDAIFGSEIFIAQ